MTSARPNYTQIRQEIVEKLRAARRVLLVTHLDPDADALGSALALAVFLEGLGKEADLFTYGSKPTAVAPNLDFLPHTEKIKHQQRLSRDFVIKVDRSQSDLTGLRYEATPAGLEIFLSPGEGGIKAESISFDKGQSDYDLIVALDSDSIDRLGPAGDAIKEQFSDIDLVVIDHHGTSTRFGVSNLVITGASSTAELVWSLLELIDEKGVTPEIATLLLTGIMSDTSGLQHSNASQRTIEIVGKLIGKGADRDMVSRKLFREKPLPVLRLWGKILSHLHTEGHSGLAWSSLSYAELREENSDEIDSGSLLSSLLGSVKDAEVVLLLIEREIGRVQVSLRSPGGIDVAKFAADHGGGGHAPAAGFTVEHSSLEDIEHDLIPHLVAYIRSEQKASGRQPSTAEPKPASRSGEVVDIFDEGPEGKRVPQKPKQTDKPQKSESRRSETAQAAPEEIEIQESEAEVSDNPADYIAEEAEGAEFSQTAERGDDVIPFSPNEYVAPKQQQGDIGVWKPPRKQR